MSTDNTNEGCTCHITCCGVVHSRDNCFAPNEPFLSYTPCDLQDTDIVHWQIMNCEQDGKQIISLMAIVQGLFQELKRLFNIFILTYDGNREISLEVSSLAIRLDFFPYVFILTFLCNLIKSEYEKLKGFLTFNK